MIEKLMALVVATFVGVGMMAGCTTAGSYIDPDGVEVRVANNFLGNGTQVVSDDATMNPNGSITFSGNVVYNSSNNTQVASNYLHWAGVGKLAGIAAGTTRAGIAAETEQAEIAAGVETTKATPTIINPEETAVFAP